ncbi:MAG TPA: ATP-binding protein [Longimicrobiales bacterium]
MLRRRSLERRLFGWLLTFALVPALLVLALATWVWTGSLDRVATLGPWTTIAESGRIVLDAAQNAAARDSALAAALEQHRDHLSASLVLARRWAFLSDRLAAALPFLALGLAAVLAALALAGSRRLARDLARPIRELVDWTERLAREEPLPPRTPGEPLATREVQALRDALRSASAELAAARRRALEAARVRAWGEMARRVAHEMKNPLTPLRIAAHRLSAALGADPELRDSLQVLEEETERLEELARQFAALGRPPEGPASPVDLHELLAALLASDVPPGIETRIDAAGDLPLVEANYDALLRAFRNLIRNAVEALETRDGDRRIEVRLSAEAVPHRGTDPARAGTRGGRSDGAATAPGWVEVVVADNGPGLPPGAEERVFDPDFTTRARGTGLGLPIVRQIVRAHGGEVTGATRPGGGAAFTVRLPAAAAVPALAR